jgi:hypothetical protein
MKNLSIDLIIQEAKIFCEQESQYENKELYGVIDGKAVGTHVENKFQSYLSSKYNYTTGSSAKGIDLPDEHLNTDIKVTSINQPQSSSPFKDARQKIYGLGYNLLVFVYDKIDDPKTKSSKLNFVSCSFINSKRTGDYQTTKTILQMLGNDANTDDIIAYLMDRNIPADDIMLNRIAEEILKNPPEQGYLTISNALQWRLQYQRIVNLSEKVDGIVKIL